MGCVQILEMGQCKVGQGLDAGRRPRAFVDLYLDLVRIDIERICLELFFKRIVRGARQGAYAGEVVPVVGNVVEVLLKQLPMSIWS